MLMQNNNNYNTYNITYHLVIKLDFVLSVCLLLTYIYIYIYIYISLFISLTHEAVQMYKKKTSIVKHVDVLLHETFIQKVPKYDFAE